MSTSVPPEDIIRRICAEYSEMPGLRVTEAQAQRLWGLDADTCRCAITYLLDTRFLCRINGDQFARIADGPETFPRPRMAKAALDQHPHHRRAV